MIAMIKVPTKAAERIARGRGESLGGMWFLSGMEDAPRKFYQPRVIVHGHKKSSNIGSRRMSA